MVVDHKGNEFKNESEMCKHWNVNLRAFRKRKTLGWSLERCLEGKSVYDHKGNKFKNESEMCKHWNISKYVFELRKSEGCSLEECLTEKSVYDHKGNKFKSESEMYKYWGVNNSVFKVRKNRGWGLEDCLSIVPKIKQSDKHVKIDDHLEIVKCININGGSDYFYCIYDDKKEMILTYDEILDYYKRYVVNIA